MSDLIINKVPIDDPSITTDENGIDISKVSFVMDAKGSVVVTPDGYYFYHDPITWASLVGPFNDEETASDHFMSELLTWYNK